MLVALSEDQEFFRETTARFLTQQAPPDALRALRDDPAGFDAGYWRQGAELGWTSLLVAEEHGEEQSADRVWSTSGWSRTSSASTPRRGRSWGRTSSPSR